MIIRRKFCLNDIFYFKLCFYSICILIKTEVFFGHRPKLTGCFRISQLFSIACPTVPLPPVAVAPAACRMPPAVAAAAAVAVAAADADNNLANFCSKSQPSPMRMGTGNVALGTGNWTHGMAWCAVAWCDVVWRISWRNKNKTID